MSLVGAHNARQDFQDQLKIMRPPARIPRSSPLVVRKPNYRLASAHLGWLRLLPCVACGAPGPNEAAHVRSGTDGGMGLKPSDRFALPLCKADHREQHQIGETAFWGTLGVDPLDLTCRLWTVSGNVEQGIRAIEKFRQRIALHQGAKP